MLIDHLKRTFADRCRGNPSYSLRAFSRSLGMDSSTVSAVLKGKRPMSLKLAKKFIDGLHIGDPNEAQALMLGALTNSAEAEFGYTEIALEQAEAIASWQHHAILELLQLKDFQASDRAIAERLNIPFGIATECLHRLERLQLVVKNRQGFWGRTDKKIATPSQIPSGALREGLRQWLIKAQESLENDSVDTRDMSGMTMAVSRARLPEAKKMIQEFRRRLSAYMEGGKLDSVYRLNIQLFPLTQEKKK